MVEGVGACNCYCCCCLGSSRIACRSPLLALLLLQVAAALPATHEVQDSLHSVRRSSKTGIVEEVFELSRSRIIQF